MRTRLESVALTLASIGVLTAGPALAVRGAMPAMDGSPTLARSVSSDAAPRGLAMKATTLDGLRRRWRSADEEDALSQAMLKTLRTRPSLFDGPEDELVRYLEVAARNCLRDARARSHRKDVGLDWPMPAGERGGLFEAGDLRSAIERQLTTTERGVLSAIVDHGERKTRAIARREGISRYRADLAIQRIQEVTTDLETAA